MIGLLLGLIFCYLQIQFGFIKFSGQGSFVVDAYPVKIIFADMLLVVIAIFLIGIFASVIPVISIFKNNNFNSKSE